MFLICKRCFDKIFGPLSEGEYKESGTKSRCIICCEERILIAPDCSIADIENKTTLPY